MSPHEFLSKANEITKDTHSSTNIYVEGQTIDYITNPSRFKEDLGKAKREIKDIGTAIKESINDRGDDNRNFLGQLGEGRLRTTIDNIAGKRLENAKDQNEIGRAFEDAYKGLGYNAKVIYTDPSKAPQLIDESGNIKSGTAYVGKDGVHTIIINVEDSKNSTRSGIIGTISEEGSHIIGKIEGRQLQTGTEEKGLESTGRATNEYFTDKYKKNDIPIETKSDGKDYSSTDFGENVGDYTEKFVYKKYDKLAESTLKNKCNNSVEQCMKLYDLTKDERIKIYSERKDEAQLVTHLESLGLSWAFGKVKLLAGVVGAGISEIVGHYNTTIPYSDDPEKLTEHQIIVAMSEIERTREVTAYLMGYSEGEILKGLTKYNGKGTCNSK